MKSKRICVFLILISILLGMLGGGFVYANEAPFANFNSYNDYCSFAYDKVWPEDAWGNRKDWAINLPDNFVYYEDISFFGEFGQFVARTPISAVEGNSYFYSMTDELGHSVSIDVDDNYKNILRIEEVLSDSDVNPNDMRVSVNNVSGTYVADGIRYIYDYKGNLDQIAWFKNGIYFRFDSYPSLSTYPSGNSTVAAKMLNLETVSEIISDVQEPDIREDYLSESIEKFVDDWTYVAKGGKRDDLLLENWETKLVIPTLKKYDYEFSHVEAKGHNYWYEYYYTKKDDNTSDSETIRISVRRNLNSFTARLGDEDYIPSDDGVVMVSDSEFRLNYNTQMVTVYLPSSIKIDRAGELRNYFDFFVLDVLNDKYPPDPVPPVNDTPDAPTDTALNGDADTLADTTPDGSKETPSWKTPIIVASCAAVVALTAIGTVVIVKKKKVK